MTATPRVLFLVDKPNWAFDHVARQIAARITDRYACSIRYVVDRPNLAGDPFDLLYVFFWGETWYQQFGIDPRRIVKEVASHRWANEEAYGLLTPQQMAAHYLTDCHIVTTPSRGLYDLLAPWHNQLFHCPNGVEPLYLAAPPVKKTGPLRIGWVGNPDDACKGLRDILIPACGTDFDFAYSRGGWTQAQLKAFYDRIDVIAVASTAESQPLPLMEGMARGCFPVATDVGVVPELITNGMNGVIAERSVEAFRAAFTWCRDHVDRIRRVGAYNHAMIARMRDWDGLAERFAQVFAYALDHAPEPAHCVAPPAMPTGESVPSEAAHGTDYAEHLGCVNPGTTSEGTYLASLAYYERELLPLLPRDRDAVCVDIGSGYGHLTRFLLEHGYRHAGVVDQSPQLLAQVQGYLGAGCRFAIHADGAAFLAAHPGMFDLITLFDVVEHFPPAALPALARALHAALRPGGRVIVRTPNMANILGGYSRYLDWTHYHGFTEFSLIQWLRDGGFTEPRVHVPPITGPWRARVNARLSRALHRWLFTMQDRTMPQCFDKNVLVWAEKAAREGEGG